MKRIRVLNVSLGVLWEWVIIPFLFYFYLPKGQNFYYLFPESFLIRLIVFLIYLFSGLYFTLFSCFCLHKIGNGTILTIDPPRKLVKDGVYNYCRNPMYLGYSFLFFSFGFLLRNISFLFISSGVIIFILVYSKLIEEKKLMKRFGEEYFLYKKEVPFIFSLRLHRNFLYNLATFLFFNILYWTIRDIFFIMKKP